MSEKSYKHITKQFGKTVRHYRKVRGISQEALAELADLHRTYIGDIERGSRNVSIVNITKLAKALQVKVSDLVRGLDKID